jgi:O-methyltransferase
MNTIITYEQLITNLIDNKITMVSKNEFNTIINNYEKILNIDGDVVECGVWRGGFSIFLSYIFQDKNIWVCDSYEGFQPLETAKHQYNKERHTPHATHNVHGPIGISLEEVQNHFKTYGLGEEERIKFLKGFVKDTLPTSGIEKIALLRIDVDAYSATLETLEELYDKVQPGGYIIFDDSCLYETLDAIKFFFNKKNINDYLIDPITNKKLNLNQSHIASDSGFPAGCYIIKELNENNI